MAQLPSIPTPSQAGNFSVSRGIAGPDVRTALYFSRVLDGLSLVVINRGAAVMDVVFEQARGGRNGQAVADWRVAEELETVKVAPNSIEIIEVPDPEIGSSRHFRVTVASDEAAPYWMFFADGQLNGGTPGADDDEDGVEVNPQGGVRYSYDFDTSTLRVNPTDPDNAALVDAIEYRTDLGSGTISSGNPAWSVEDGDIVFGPDANVEILGTIEYLVLRDSGRILEFLQGEVALTPVPYPAMTLEWDGDTDVLTITSPHAIFEDVTTVDLTYYDYDAEDQGEVTIHAEGGEWTSYTVVSPTVITVADASASLGSIAIQIAEARSAIGVMYGRFQGEVPLAYLYPEVTAVVQSDTDEVTVTGVGFLTAALGPMLALSFNASVGLPQFFTPAGIDAEYGEQDPGVTVGTLTDTSWTVSHADLAANTLDTAYAEHANGSETFIIEPPVTLS